jgi:hypothetical protein
MRHEPSPCMETAPWRELIRFRADPMVGYSDGISIAPALDTAAVVIDLALAPA